MSVLRSLGPSALRCACLSTLLLLATNEARAQTWSRGGHPYGQDAHLAYDEARGRLICADSQSLWALEGTRWEQVSRIPTGIGRTQGLVYDPLRARLVLLRGNAILDEQVLETWLFDGTKWSQAKPTTAPPGRNAHAMSWDGTRQRVLLFGGDNRTLSTTVPYLADTWLYDGAKWVKAAPSQSPPARARAAMAEHRAAKRVLLFGGAANAFLGDSWLWDGKTWAQLSGTTAPSPRYAHAMACDPTRKQVVLFGGRTSNFRPVGDTWVFDGTKWTQASPLRSPSARTDHAMAYDPKLGGVLLHGGYELNKIYASSDSWLWTGADWKLVPPPADGVPASG